MSTIKELQAEAAKIVADMEALDATVTAENSAEVTETITRSLEKVKAINERIAQKREIERLASTSVTEVPSVTRAIDTAAPTLSEKKAFRSWALGNESPRVMAALRTDPFASTNDIGSE